jgi:hypothetical protein
MSCKLSDKCDNVFACNVLRPEVELLGCSFYKPKKPMTNEEWLHTLNTEQFADKLTDFSFWLVPNLPTEDKREQIRKRIENWLKEKHDESV